MAAKRNLKPMFMFPFHVRKFVDLHDLKSQERFINVEKDIFMFNGSMEKREKVEIVEATVEIIYPPTYIINKDLFLF